MLLSKVKIALPSGLNSLCVRAVPFSFPDRPWEAGGLTGDSNVSVIEYGGEYKLWYGVPVGKLGSKKEKELKKKLAGVEFKNLDEKILDDFFSRTNRMLCYAVSGDGENWEKPELGLVEHEGSKKNNIVFIARLGATVFLDSQAPASERYKMIYGAGPRIPHINLKDDSSPGLCYQAVYGAYSSDEIHWNQYPEPIMPWYTDTTNVCYRDDEKKRYAAFVRYNEGMFYKDEKTYSREHGRIAYRAIGRSESKDFQRFPPPVNTHEPKAEERRPHQKSMDYYNSAAMKYPFAPSSYFLFVSEFYHNTKMLDVHLAS